MEPGGRDTKLFVNATVRLKDVAARYNIRNVNFLENLIWFLADSNGTLISSLPPRTKRRKQEQYVPAMPAGRPARLVPGTL